MNLELETERLLLRPLQADDIDWCIEMLTDPEVVRYIYEDDVYSEQEVRDEMPLATRRGAGGCIGIWAIVRKEDRKCLGDVFLLPLPIEEDDTNWDLVQFDLMPEGEIEIGYILRKFAWGQGYATEAASRLLQFAFEETDLQEVVAVVDPKHSASSSVLRKTGLIEEGLRLAYAEQNLGYRITRERWKRQFGMKRRATESRL